MGDILVPLCFNTHLFSGLQRGLTQAQVGDGLKFEEAASFKDGLGQP